MNPSISIIILNWNGREYLQDCLASVFNQGYDNFKVIFVDNHSTDDSVDFVRQNFPNAEIITLDENYGFAKGNNIGIKHTIEKHNPDYIFLLNNDTIIVKKDVLKQLIDIAESDKKIGILGCRLIFCNGRIQYVGTQVKLLSPLGIKWIEPFKKIPHEAYEVYSASGAAFLIKRFVINRIGLFDEGFSPLYYEEIDYCARARKAKFLVKMAYSLEIMHHHGGSSRNKPPEYLNFVLRTNSIRFALLNFPLPLLIVRIFYEFYLLLKYLPANILERKHKDISIAPFNLRIRQNFKNSLIFLFNPYAINLKNLRDIIYKRVFRTKKIY